MTSRLGIIVPTYKEQECIGVLLRALHESAPEATKLVVDDSPDEATVEAVAREDLPNVEAWHRKGKGRGTAVLDGMRRLLDEGYDWVIEMDADISHPPEQVPDLYRAATERKLDLVIASRYVPGGKTVNWPLQRRILSRGANLLARLALGIPVADYTTGYRIYSRAAVEKCLEHCGGRGSGFIVISECLVSVYYRGLAVGEIPSTFTDRELGQSTMGPKEMIYGLLGLWKIRKLRKALERG